MTGRWFGWDGGYGSYLDISPPHTAALTILGYPKTDGSYRIIKGQYPFSAELRLEKPEEIITFAVTLLKNGTLILNRKGYDPIHFSRQPEGMFKEFWTKNDK